MIFWYSRNLVDCDAEKFARISRPLEKRAKQSVLVAIDGSCRLLGWCFCFQDWGSVWNGTNLSASRFLIIIVIVVIIFFLSIASDYD